VHDSGSELPGGVLFWRATGKLALLVFAVTITISALLGTYKGHLGTVAAGVEGQRHELVDRNITLRVTRAKMLTQQAVEAAAGKALSLYAPDKGQRLVYNSDKGRFDSL
jgi:hypothetical protein